MLIVFLFPILQEAMKALLPIDDIVGGLVNTLAKLVKDEHILHFRDENKDFPVQMSAVIEGKAVSLSQQRVMSWAEHSTFAELCALIGCHLLPCELGVVLAQLVALRELQPRHACVHAPKGGPKGGQL